MNRFDDDLRSTILEIRAARVEPAFIRTQRALGWPDIHPEDYCHKCGEENFTWVTDRETWLVATKAWAEQTGREGICCPRCFAEMYEAATGKRVNWTLSIHTERAT